MGVLKLADKFHLGWNDFYHASSSLATYIKKGTKLEGYYINIGFIITIIVIISCRLTGKS